MDHRIALKPKTQLRLCNEKGEAIHCIIENEIGRGGSCIVYEASRETETGDRTLYRVKEFYPYKLNISREENDSLIPAPQDEEVFYQRQEQLHSDFSRTNRLFYSGFNYASMSNQLDVFRQNGTSYVLSTYSSKKTLATYKPESLKECIVLVKQVAYVLGNIHKQGYLYLDTKPDNVLVVDGIQKQVQLFDFDSLLLLSDIRKSTGSSCSDIRLSYSKGFAPIELQTSKIKRLGPHTDVFGVGALLFYLLFGTTPKAPDCDTDAEYYFEKIQYDYNRCDDKLFIALSHFFHKALAVYYADRYQSMQEVYDQLQEVEKFADVTIPRIFSTQIIKPRYLFGREHEFEEMDRFLSKTDYNCLFVTGMGGIGKSVFVREYLFRYQKKFDTVLYMQFKDSIENTISNDNNIEINTLRQDEEAESCGRYFDKKLKKIRELVRGTSSVIVIDNFTGEVDDDLQALLATECKVVLIIRKAPTYQSSYELNINAVSNPYALRQIFEANLGRSITEDEQDSFEKILQRIDCHTLILELIAKQITNNHNITISSAVALADEYGFSSIAPEKVDYEKDNRYYSDTIGNIIDAFFEANALSESKKILMKVASLLGDDGIDINQFHHILKIESKDDANELLKDGWLMIADDVISMHPVIQEAVHRWEWNKAFVDASEQFLSYFYIEIRLESTKNNFPKKLRDHWMIMERSASLGAMESKMYRKMLAWRDQTMEKRFQKQGLIGNVMRERYTRANDETPADIEKLTSLLFQAEDILRQCKKEDVIKSNDVYVNLLYVTVLNMPRYKEEYILAETNEIFSKNEDDFVMKGTIELLNDSERRNPITIMQLYAMVILIFAENGRINDAENLLGRAKKLAEKARYHMVYALYFNLCSDYYDILLNGAYDTEDPDEKLLLNKMLDAIEQTLHYSKKTVARDSNHLYAKNILAKATILMRSGRGGEDEINSLLDTAQKVIMENTLPYADVRLQYYLVCGWYFALVHDSAKATDVFVQKAQELSEKITSSALRRIEEVIIPCANMFFELGCHGKALGLLYDGTRFCADHANTDSYARIKKELCDHLWQVGIEAEAYELCEKIIQLIECENEDIVDPKNKVVIPEGVRSIMTNKKV
uniref:protein kinase domain-containing protein n=1 Tax=Agathobacter sp. TaxID=2021311 RepID=UPI004056FFDB